jgi:hypothetical protein
MARSQSGWAQIITRLRRLLQQRQGRRIERRWNREI